MTTAAGAHAHPPVHAEPDFTESTDTQSDVRWGGALLALTAATFIVTIFLYAVVYGQPEPTGAEGEVTLQDRATHLSDRWWFISKVWIAESIAMMLLTVTGLALLTRAAPTLSWVPVRLAWGAVALGALLQTVMYTFMLGGYPSAIEDTDGSLALYGTLRDSASFLFYLGNAALYLGLAGVFLSEVSPQGVLPKWLGIGVAVVCLLTTFLMVGLIAGVGDMMLAAPGALIGYLAAVYLGLAIWRQRMYEAVPQEG